MVKKQNEKESCNSFNNAIYPNLKRANKTKYWINYRFHSEWQCNSKALFSTYSDKNDKKKVQNFNKDMQVIKVKST